MNPVRRIAAALGLSAFALLASCTEVDGQRISLHHDAATDTLRLLLHYDGIHEKEGDAPAGAKKIAEFLENGDLMLLDWFGHVDMKELRATAAKEETRPAMREFLLCLTDSVKCTVLGRYRDPAGRIGAAQMVEIRPASVFLKKANTALNEAVLHGEPDRIWRRTAERMRPGALEGRQWLFLDGHSVGITFAADPAEWARNKAELVEEMMKEFARERKEPVEPPPPADPVDGEKAAPPGRALPDPSFQVQFLALSPVSLVETREAVTLRIGDPGHPSTLRLRMREACDGSLDEVVKKSVPRELDGALAGVLLEGKPAEEAGLRALLEWGPPEERARVLLSIAKAETGERREAALKGLAAFAVEWNREVGIPEAPGGSTAEEYTGETLGEWGRWYDDVLRGGRR